MSRGQGAAGSGGKGRRSAKRRKRPLLSALFWLLALGLIGVNGAVVAGLGVYWYYSRDAASLDVRAAQTLDAARIYDAQGRLLYEFEDSDGGLREHTPLAQLSPWLVRATVATEDATFYTNPGINPRGVLRALWENRPGRDGFLRGSGGSGITQQLVKNLYIAEEERYSRSPQRKLKEAALALALTKRYSKDEILERYLNTIYYGNRAYGAGAAARRYFGVPASELTLAQAALLAGLPQAPANLDPLRNPAGAKERQEEVLALMVRAHAVTPERAAAARAEPLVYAPAALRIEAPHWVFTIAEQLEARFGKGALYRSGLRVTTALDLEVQRITQQAVSARVAEFEAAGCGCRNGAAVVIENATGRVLAMVGSRDFERADIQGEVNNATSPKQTGSTLKPFVYLATFLKDWTPATTVWDVRKAYPNPGGEPFVPVGPAAQYQGPVTVRQALGSSLNAPAVAAAAYAGVPAVIETARKLGIGSLNTEQGYGVAIATGGASASLLELTHGYSTLANNGLLTGVEGRNGRRIEPQLILKVVDGTGRTLYEPKAPKREQAVPAAHAAMVSDILQDDSARRLIYAPGMFDLRDRRPVAAKTGTQQGRTVDEVRSTWNVGYTPDLTVGVWVGNTDGSMLRSVTSAQTALRIWKDVLQGALDQRGISPKPFPRPQGLARVQLQVPGANGCRTVEDLAPQGRAPSSETCRRVLIDTRNGLLASDATPAEFLQEVAYIDAPEEARGYVGAALRTGQPPSAVSQLTATPEPAPTAIATPTATPTRTATPQASATPRAAVPSALSTPRPAHATATPARTDEPQERSAPVTPPPQRTSTIGTPRPALQSDRATAAARGTPGAAEDAEDAEDAR